jgi:O-antigen/teichoic acid export membrane protein
LDERSERAAAAELVRGSPAADGASSELVPRRVWRGTFLQMLGRLWSAACTLVILRLAAGSLSAADFGRFTFYLNLFAWLDSFVNLGTGEVAVQRTANHPEAVPSVLKAARRVRLATGAIGVAIVGGGAILLGERGSGWILLAACYPVSHVLELSTTVFKNRISWGMPVAVRWVAATASLTCVFLLARSDSDQPALFLLAVACGSTLGNVLLHVFARPHLPRPHGHVEPASGIFSAAWPLGLSSMCAMAYFYVDNVFVRAIAGEEALGPYNVAVRVMSILIMVAQYTTLSALPWLARRHAQGQLADAILRIGPGLFALAGFGAGLLWPWTERILALFEPAERSAGPPFAIAGTSLRWLLCAMTSIYAGSLLLTAVVAMGNNRAKLWVQSSGLALNVVANFWAVPAYGITGAGMTTFATEFFVAIAAGIALTRSGIPVFRGGRWALWLGGPAAFALAAWISSGLPIG